MGVIVVGVDDSAGARAALRFALEEARFRQARLRAVHAIGSFGSHRPLEWGDVRAVRRAAEELLENVTREVAGELDDFETSAASSTARQLPVSPTNLAAPICSWSARAATAASPASGSARSASSVPSTRPAQS
jgi:cell division septation protein DedD